MSFDFLQNVSLTQSPRSSLITPNWILLDSESTIYTFCNKDLLTNICESPDGKILKVYTNGGSQESKKVGTLEGFGEVWYNPKSLANILSMAAVRKQFRITMDSSVDAAMIIHLPSSISCVLQMDPLQKDPWVSTTLTLIINQCYSKMISVF